MAKGGYHHGDLEAALVDSAMQVVLSDGVGALTVRDLARTIGVSPSAAYRHFPSRDHMVAALSLRAREELARSMLAARDAVPATGPKAGRSVRHFEAIGRAYIRFALRQPRLFEVAFAPSSVPPPAPEHPSAWGVLVDAIDEMAATGAIPAARSADAPLVAWAGVHGLSTILTASKLPSESGLHHSGDEAMIDAVIDAVIRSLR